MALQTKTYTQSSNGFTLELTLVEQSTSTAGNSSTLSYTLKLKSTTKNFAQYGVGAAVKLDNQTVAVRDRGSAPKITLGTYSEVTLLSGTRTVAHTSDGSKSMALAYSLDMASASYTPGAMSGSGTMTLTKIPRGATITSAPNFTDADDPAVKVSNPAGVSVQLGIFKDGYTPLADYRTISGTSYTFRLTQAEREAMRKVDTTKNTAQVRFYVKSTVGGQTFITYLTRTLTIQNPAPTLAPTVKDVNQTTLALTGESGNLVKYHSQVAVKTGAQAVKGASLVRQSVTCGSHTLTGDGTLEGVESGTIVVSATDSRGNTTTKTVERKLVGYVRLSCTLGQGTPDASGRYDLEVAGACYYGSFGASENTLTVEYRYREMSLRMRLALTSFKHVGIFPEQAANWNFIYDRCRALAAAAAEPPRVLNLFAYTGGATLAARAAGAEVTHVDSVRQVVTWARENMEASGLDGVRWIVEDALKFVHREVRRDNRYAGIILDPPAYGRGANGEKWVLEEGICEMLECCARLLEVSGAFLVLNLYSMGLSSTLARTAVHQAFGAPREEQWGELCFTDRGGKQLPLGTYYRFAR